MPSSPFVHSAIKALLDTQAEQHQQMAAQEKTLRDVQRLIVGSRKLASDAARREEQVRATAAAETAASMSKLREDVSTARVRRGADKKGSGGLQQTGVQPSKVPSAQCHLLSVVLRVVYRLGWNICLIR